VKGQVVRVVETGQLELNFGSSQEFRQGQVWGSGAEDLDAEAKSPQVEHDLTCTEAAEQKPLEKWFCPEFWLWEFPQRACFDRLTLHDSLFT